LQIISWGRGERAKCPVGRKRERRPSRQQFIIISEEKNTGEGSGD